MAVAVQTGTTLTGASAASAVVTLPSGITADDIVIVSLYKENTAAVTPPSGFVEKGTAPTTTSPIAGHTFWKRMSGGESGTVTFTWAGSVFREASAVRISGAHTTGDPIVQFTSAQSNGASSLNASFTNTTVNGLLYSAMGDFTSSTDFTPPSGFTENYDGGDLGDSWKATVGGATGTLTYTATNFSGVTMTLMEITAPTYLSHATVAMGRNGTTTHTAVADGTGGTVIDGTGFSPTAGRLLLCFVEGSVTSTTPSGWTLPTNGSAVANTGLYVFTRTADGTSADQVVTTHNASDYPVVYDFYEFPAGSTFVGSNSATGVANNSSATGPTLGSLTGTNWTAATHGQANSSLATNGVTTWVTGSEEVDTSVLRAGTGPTDGYVYSLAHINEDTTATAGMAANVTPTATTLERLIVAVKLPTTAAATVSPDIPIQLWPWRIGRWPRSQLEILSPPTAAVNDFVGDAALAVTETTTATGQTQGAASLTGTATITTAGAAQGAASLSVTDAITASGQAQGAVAFTATATITASGVVATSSAASLSETATITAAGVAATTSAASLTVTATITAAGSLGGTDLTGTSTLTVTGSVTASGVAATSSGASLTETATVTATGQPRGAVAFTVTETTTVSGQTRGTAALSSTATTTAAGQTQGAASLTVTATITAAGSVSGGTLSGSSTLTVTATRTVAGNMAATGTAAILESATITAVGGTLVAGSASRSTTATVTVTGNALGAAAVAVTAAFIVAGNVGIDTSIVVYGTGGASSGGIPGGQAGSVVTWPEVSGPGPYGDGLYGDGLYGITPAGEGMAGSSVSGGQAGRG